MMRLLGVLVGSALAVAALVVFVGIPEFTTESTIAERDVITLPMRASPAADDPARVLPQPDMPPAASTPAPAVPQQQEQDTEAEPQPEPEPEPEPRWYAFWSPFRSEIAANGFVDQLQRVTALDYRVVKVKPGVYEVAFAYGDDMDISAKLAQISAATGLQLAEN